MALRKIREFGDEVLNKECKEVTKMTIRTKVLINDMLDTMYEACGVGLAAPSATIFGIILCTIYYVYMKKQMKEKTA